MGHWCSTDVLDNVHQKAMFFDNVQDLAREPGAYLISNAKCKSMFTICAVLGIKAHCLLVLAVRLPRTPRTFHLPAAIAAAYAGVPGAGMVQK